MMTLKKIYEAVLEPKISFLNIMKNLKNKLIGKNLSTLEIIDILNMAFRKKFISFNITYNFPGSSADNDLENVHINSASTATYGVVEVNVYNDFYEIFENDEKWNDLLFTLGKVLKHEFVHVAQMKKMKKNYLFNKFKSENPEKIRKYLSNKQELMAYAREAVEEFTRFYPKEKILNRLRNPFSTNIFPDRSESDTFWTYTEWFDANEQPFKTFLKYMYQYLTKKK